jgi:uncharacterized protein YhaN
MRFLRLELRAFGPFADSPPIDLSGGSRGLHLIHGPNEAGKSSALRAIRCLLFGFPVRLNDDHRHAYKDLRVGATLLGEQETEISFLRRKGDVRTLRTLDDDDLIADEVLETFLGGVDRTKFDEFFAMDHAELVAGGRAIVEGKGNLGSMLFAAGSGLAGFEAIRKALDAEIDELFKPAGRNPAINAALAQLREAREASEKAMLATTDWVELDASLTKLRSEKEAKDSEIRRVESEKRRSERLRDALPVMARIDRVQAILDGFGDAPELSEGFADRRSEAVVALNAGTRAASSAESALEAIALEIDGFGPRNLVLDEADAIRRVRDDLGLYRKALEDRPVEQARLARREADALGMLAELRPGVSLDDADSLRIPAVLKGRVQGLAQELAALQAGLSNAEAEVAKLIAASPGLDLEAVTLDASRRAEALARAIQQARAQGDLEAQLSLLLDDLAKLEQQANVDLQALPLWSGTLDALEVLPVPTPATIDRFENEFRAVDEALDRLERDLASLETERDAIDRAIDRRQGSGPVPSDEELAVRRGLRDDTWREVRRAWLDREPVEAPAQLADTFEAALRASDDLADRLRREADAVAEQAQRHWRRLEVLDLIARSIEARDRARAEQAGLRQSWLEIWQAIGLEPLTPREMKDWVVIRRADLVRQAKTLRERRLEQARKASKVDEFKREIGGHLEGLGELPAAVGESLGVLLARAGSTVNRVNAGLNLHEARIVVEKARASLLDGKARWASAVGPLGLEADATPAEALAVIGRFDDLAAILREIVELRSKIDEQVRSENRFEAAVRSLIERLGLEPSRPSLEATALDLDDQLKRALVIEARREESLKRQKSERSKLEKARSEVDRASASLESLMAEAGCESPDGLVEALRISDAIKDSRRDLRSFEEQLATLAGPISVDKIREQAEGVDPESLEARIVELTEQLNPLALERDRLGEEIGRCRNRLEAMDGGPAAADAQQVVEERVARLAIDVEKYARLRLASAVLREAVERYRKEHQGPILDRAGALFAQLTTGSFGGLKADHDDKGEPVLLGLRADGTPLKVDGMSEGTADQLYLALRLASLQTYLDAHEPMPLVVDDILVNFDNPRALAALQALAELSKRTQVLFFTHHEHLIDLARAGLPGDTLMVHHLPFPPVSVKVEAVEAIGSTSEAGKPKRKKKAVVLDEKS